MKSLEIVNDYINLIDNFEFDKCYIGINELKQIKADLEVLEILKKYLYYIDHTIKLKSISKSLYNFDYEKIKQWLEENENDR